MRKIFLLSALALAVAGCANHQGNPQVRDISEVMRNLDADSQYTVEQGDTLYGIAWQQGLDYRQLAALNGIEPPYNIYPGQQLMLQSSSGEGNRERAQISQPAPEGDEAPGSSGVVTTGLDETPVQVAANVQQVDWLLPDDSASEKSAQDDGAPDVQDELQASEAQASETQEPPSEASEKQASEASEESPEPETQPEPEPSSEIQPEASSRQQPSADRSDRTYMPAESIDWQWPADGEVVGTFGGDESITAGIDIAGQKGQSVKASGPGVVVYAGSGVRGYGNLILIKHNDEFLSAYAHNDTLRVKENDVIEGGEVIATMGNSSAEEEARLHFEIRKQGQPEDPLTYLPRR